MSKATDKATNSRRDFLKLASASAPAAVAAVALTGTEAEAVETATKGSGLQDTAHTRAYFDSARF
ncbi:MAG: twin-arginine translocation signal domain-containing protein [Albidovulum sp.]